MQNEKILQLVVKGLVLDPVDGKRILADASDLFVHIDGDFHSWNADEPGEPTGETLVDVHEMVSDADFAKMFGSLSLDSHQLCLSQDQIGGFVEKHRNWLRTDGFATFFLFESYGERFVALVFVRSRGGLGVLVHRFENSRVWYAEDRHRLVVPQLAAS